MNCNTTIKKEKTKQFIICENIIAIQKLHPLMIIEMEWYLARYRQLYNGQKR